jgi:hypothetical protein
MPDTSVPLSAANPIPFKAADNADGTFSLGIAAAAALQATLLGSSPRAVSPPIGVIANPNSLVRGLRLYWVFTAIPATGAAPTLELDEVEPATAVLRRIGTALAAPAAGTAATAAAPVLRTLLLYPAALNGANGAAVSFDNPDMMLVSAFDRVLQAIVTHTDGSLWTYSLAASLLP